MKQMFLTLGDPHSINAEAIAHLLSRQDLQNFSQDHPVYLLGSHSLFTQQVASLSLPLPPIKRIDDFFETHEPKGFIFCNLHSCEKEASALEDRERGEIANAPFRLISKISSSWTDKTAVLTAPIDKLACSKAGFLFPGQTEFFTELWGGDSLMALLGAELRVGLVTNHLPLGQVAKELTEDLVYKKGKILATALSHIANLPKIRAMNTIAVCGLNPHCGDGGLFGDEEARIILPAVVRLKEEGFVVHGPVPADTAFYQARMGRYAAVLAMYHDQGIGPLKTIHFDSAINVTLGLKHLRVAPDHGPAKDLYLTGRASFKSFFACMDHILAYL